MVDDHLSSFTLVELVANHLAHGVERYGAHVVAPTKEWAQLAAFVEWLSFNLEEAAE